MGIGRARCAPNSSLLRLPALPALGAAEKSPESVTTVSIVPGLRDLISLSVIGENSKVRPDNSEKPSCHLIRRRRQYMVTLALFLNRLL
jgi:hypothetical protein